MAKGFDQSCPISALRPAASASTALRGELKLSVNGEMRQRGDLSDMIWSPGECLAVLSTLVELRAGDLLLTGTPAGVGPVAAGDVLEASCAITSALRVEYLAVEAR
jgi:fumarylpyruvate hydrolase